jgi:hypothetical protein
LRALTEPTGCPQGIPSGGSAFAVAHLAYVKRTALHI